MTTITWLHLSDLHFRTGEQQAWDRDIVLDTLLDDVRERIKRDGLRPDFILVSGDIAFSGSADEYILAGAFFDELLVATSLSKERLFVVPGNHDVDRSAIGLEPIRITPLAKQEPLYLGGDKVQTATYRAIWNRSELFG